MALLKEDLEAMRALINEEITPRFNSIDNRVESLSNRVESLDNRVNVLGRLFDSMNSLMESLDNRVGSLDIRMETLNSQLKGIDSRMSERFDQVIGHIDGFYHRDTKREEEYEVIRHQLVELEGRVKF